MEAEERRVERLVQLWKEQEAIAMHFNDLIARFRVQALAGTSAIGAIAALVNNKLDASPWTFFAVLSFLFVAWAALWQLDYGYYHRLLGGSVKALLELEEQLPAYAGRFSTTIERHFRTAFHGHFYFYTMIQVALGALVLVAFYDSLGHISRWFWSATAAVVLLLLVVIRAAWPSAESRARARIAKRMARVMASQAKANAAERDLEIDQLRWAAEEAFAKANAAARVAKAEAKAKRQSIQEQAREEQDQVRAAIRAAQSRAARSGG